MSSVGWQRLQAGGDDELLQFEDLAGVAEVAADG